MEHCGLGHKHVVLATNNNTYALGSSPCYGELGYGDGEKRSSTLFKPMAPIGQFVYAHRSTHRPVTQDGTDATCTLYGSPPMHLFFTSVIGGHPLKQLRIAHHAFMHAPCGLKPWLTFHIFHIPHIPHFFL